MRAPALNPSGTPSPLRTASMRAMSAFSWLRSALSSAPLACRCRKRSSCAKRFALARSTCASHSLIRSLSPLSFLRSLRMSFSVLRSRLDVSSRWLSCLIASSVSSSLLNRRSFLIFVAVNSWFFIVSLSFLSRSTSSSFSRDSWDDCDRSTFSSDLRSFKPASCISRTSFAFATSEFIVATRCSNSSSSLRITSNSALFSSALGSNTGSGGTRSVSSSSSSSMRGAESLLAGRLSPSLPRSDLPF
mmetsp:Transcript_20094/g.42152  ORF Transcript_20094/g.42152 Transcript_20094/m.42152 type:complete len:246 (-) Transcript_20094:160-897(-)